MKIGNLRVTIKYAMKTSWTLNRYKFEETFHCADSDLIIDLFQYKGQCTESISLRKIVKYLQFNNTESTGYSAIDNATYIVRMILADKEYYVDPCIRKMKSWDELYEHLNRELER
jgi:hypothetical protein